MNQKKKSDVAVLLDYAGSHKGLTFLGLALSAVSMLLSIVRKHMNFEELTHTLLREFVEKIVVHECSYDENGTRRQDIEIYYSFVGKVDLPE